MADLIRRLPVKGLFFAGVTTLGFAFIGAFSFAGLCLTLPVGGIACGVFTWLLFYQFDSSLSLWKSLVGWSVAGLLAIMVTLVFPSPDFLSVRASILINATIGGTVGGLVGGAAVAESTKTLGTRKLLVIFGWTIGGALGGFATFYSTYINDSILQFIIGGFLGGAVFGLFGGSFTVLAFELGDYV